MSNREELTALNTEFDNQKSERDQLKQVKEPSYKESLSASKRKQFRKELI